MRFFKERSLQVELAGRGGGECRMSLMEKHDGTDGRAAGGEATYPDGRCKFGEQGLPGRSEKARAESKKLVMLAGTCEMSPVGGGMSKRCWSWLVGGG